MNATIQMTAIAGGPMRITNRSSARVRAEHFIIGLLSRCHSPAAAAVAIAFTVRSIVKTSVIPRNSYIVSYSDSALFSFPALNDQVRRAALDLARLLCRRYKPEPVPRRPRPALTIHQLHLL